MLLTKPVSEYYNLRGIQALLIDSAIGWAKLQELPQDTPTGLKIVTNMQRSEMIKK